MTTPTSTRNPNPRFPDTRLVVFDLDGTLVDAFEDIAAAVNHMLALDGKAPLPLDDVKRHVGRGVRVLVGGVLGTDDEELITAKVDVLAEYYKQHPVKHARLYDDAHATLEALRQKGIRTAVASNKPDVLTRHVLDVLGIGGLLDWIIGQSDAFPRKPSPDVLHHLMKLAGADSASTLMIGDSVTDVEFARAAGVKIVGVTYGQCTAGEVERFGPDAIVHSLKELPALFG